MQWEVPAGPVLGCGSPWEAPSRVLFVEQRLLSREPGWLAGRHTHVLGGLGVVFALAARRCWEVSQMAAFWCFLRGSTPQIVTEGRASTLCAGFIEKSF